MSEYILQPCDFSDLQAWYQQECQSIISPVEREIAEYVGKHLENFVKWSLKAELLWDGCDRIPEQKGKQKYHQYPSHVKERAKNLGISLDARSNGPAIAAFLLAGGHRPERHAGNNKWSIHHIYNNKFPYIGRKTTLHSVKSGNHFTQSAGLVAVHPIADQMCDEYPFLAWLLRAESFKKFGYDPDEVFSTSGCDSYGFCKGSLSALQ